MDRAERLVSGWCQVPPPSHGGLHGMAMTLRLSPAQSAALRRRALAEDASMQDVVRRAVETYLRAHEPEVPLSTVVDQQLARFAGALERLGRWRD